MEKEQIKSIKKSIREAVKKDDDKALFDNLSLFDANQQFKCLNLMFENNELYRKAFKHVIAQLDSLSIKNQAELKNQALNFYDYDLFNDLGGYYCDKTKNTQDRIFFLDRKCEFLIDSVNLNQSELENSVNQIFDLLIDDRIGNSYNYGSLFYYFEKRLEAVVYLSNDRLKTLLTDSDWHITQEEILKNLDTYRSPEETNLYLKKYAEISITTTSKNKFKN